MEMYIGFLAFINLICSCINLSIKNYGTSLFSFGTFLLLLKFVG